MGCTFLVYYYLCLGLTSDEHSEPILALSCDPIFHVMLVPLSLRYCEFSEHLAARDFVRHLSHAPLVPDCFHPHTHHLATTGNPAVLLRPLPLPSHHTHLKLDLQGYPRVINSIGEAVVAVDYELILVSRSQVVEDQAVEAL
jgi:hypothetical protein